MQDYVFKINQITYSCYRSNPFVVHVEHDNGAYDCVEIPFSFNNFQQFKEFAFNLHTKYGN